MISSLLAHDGLTIRHFRHNLEGREFFINTDPKPLTYVMNSTTERLSLHQTMHLAYIAEFTTDITGLLICRTFAIGCELVTEKCAKQGYTFLYLCEFSFLVRKLI